MPGKTEVQWTDKSWNPVTGCTKVSAGCDHCYAATFAERWRGIPGHPYEQGFDLRLWPSRLDIPIRWTKPSRIFVNSMSDLFHADVPTEFIARVFAVMAATPRHTFQVLTKRPRRMARVVGDPTFPDAVAAAADDLAGDWGWCHIWGNASDDFAWPLPNVWLGTSVENQEAAYRLDWLVKTPAAVRFVSAEPLLGPLDFDKWLRPSRLPGFGGQTATLPPPQLDWIITGGESGPGHRAIDPDWVRSIRDQCLDGHVAFFHKQWGGHTPKAGGRELDGRTWDEMPAAPAAAGTDGGGA